jgi:predicted dehydrogenase
MTPGAKLGVGLLGCGAFGRFCLREFAAMPGLRPAAVADTIPEAARKTGEEFAVPVCADIHALAARDDVQIIHIATPPSTHRELAIAALDASKHVLCEKPLATTLADARRMIDAARTARRFLAVNLIMRYDPLNQAVARILEAGLLGAPLHAFFENYAGDTPLGPGHWFWRPLLN